MNNIYDFSESEISGKPINFSDFKNKVVLVVNTASKCGLAPQLKELEELHQKYQAQGLVVIGTPSNQFHQELKTDADANEYCQIHFGVTFPITQRVVLNGDDEDQLYTYLKAESGHGRIKWNFTKFLIGPDGNLIHRYAPTTTPLKMEADIQQAISEIQ